MPCRLLLVKYLAQAEEFIRLGRERISEQMRVIERMEKAGRDTDLATTVLRVLEHSQELFESDHERLRTELARLPALPSVGGDKAEKDSR